MSSLERRLVKIRSNERTQKLGIAEKMGLVVEQMRTELSVRVNGLPITLILSEEDVELEPLKGRLFLTKGDQKAIINKIILVDQFAQPPPRISKILSSAWERRYKATLATPISVQGHLVDTINGFELAGLMDHNGNWALDCPAPNQENPVIFSDLIPESELT